MPTSVRAAQVKRTGPLSSRRMNAATTARSTTSTSERRSPRPEDLRAGALDGAASARAAGAEAWHRRRASAGGAADRRLAPSRRARPAARWPAVSSVGSNSTETSPKRTVAPGPSGDLALHPLAVDPGAVGGVEVGQDPDALAPLQLGVRRAHARLGKDEVVVVGAADVHHRHPHRQPLPLERSRSAPGARRAAATGSAGGGALGRGRRRTASGAGGDRRAACRSGPARRPSEPAGSATPADGAPSAALRGAMAGRAPAAGPASPSA